MSDTTAELDRARRELSTFGRASAPLSSDVIAELERVAAGGAPPDDRWLRLLGGRRRSRLTMREGAASLLTQLGVWDGHEDLAALASPLLAPPAPAPSPLAMHTEPTLDATDIPLVAIDGADPHEIDDALHVERDGDDLRMWIAIAAPACWILPGDELDLDARTRGASLYHPRYHVPMLDPALSADAASLLPGERRPALLLRLRIDAAGGCVTESLSLAWVRVAAAWSYDQAEAALDAGDAPAWLQAAWEATERSERARIQSGAYLLYRPDVELRAPAHAEPTLRMTPQAARSRRIVSESMVRAGMAIAAWLEQRGVPAPFRGHVAVRQPPSPPGIYVDAADIGAILGAMGPAKVLARSTPHGILGAAAYVQAGSPLRRYGDLLVQHQVLASLSGRATPMDAGPMLEAAQLAAPRRREMRRLERSGMRYFQMLLLSRRGLGVRLRGQIQGGGGGPPRALVVELGLEVELPSYAGSVGDWVTLVVEGVDPMRRRVDVRIA